MSLIIIWQIYDRTRLKMYFSRTLHFFYIEVIVVAE